MPRNTRPSSDRCQSGLPCPGGKYSSSSGWPSGSRNLKARTRPSCSGRVCGSPLDREGNAAQLRICGVHVGDDDGKMLKPQVRTAATPWIEPAPRAILEELHLVTPEPHHRGLDGGGGRDAIEAG